MSLRQERMAEERVNNLRHSIYLLEQKLQATEDATEKAEIERQLQSLNEDLDRALASNSY